MGLPWVSYDQTVHRPLLPSAQENEINKTPIVIIEGNIDLSINVVQITVWQLAAIVYASAHNLTVKFRQNPG